MNAKLISRTEDRDLSVSIVSTKYHHHQSSWDPYAYANLKPSCSSLQAVAAPMDQTFLHLRSRPWCSPSPRRPHALPVSNSSAPSTSTHRWRRRCRHYRNLTVCRRPLAVARPGPWRTLGRRWPRYLAVDVRRGCRHTKPFL